MSGSTVGEIEAVYRSRFPAYLRVAVAIAGDEELARDAVHDAFVRALRHRARYRGEGRLEAWLWRIVVNEARRRRSPTVQVVPAEVADTGASSENGYHETDHVAALVTALPERQRLILFLRYYADLDYAAIAEALDVAPGTVAASLNAAHARLRARLEEVDRC
ncbi:MAG: sigma-70 family RNA polymerase sigma factor [Thermoleophilia bacterium]|nr:sigma-70 family RNA polymerase sigma factor [Thermoleophilia bacterium]